MKMKIGIIGLKHNLGAWSNYERQLAIEELMERLKMEDQIAELAKKVNNIETFPDIRGVVR